MKTPRPGSAYLVRVDRGAPPVDVTLAAFAARVAELMRPGNEAALALEAARCLSVEETAELIGVSEATVRRCVARPGGLRAVRTGEGGRVVIPLAALLEFERQGGVAEAQGRAARRESKTQATAGGVRRGRPSGRTFSAAASSAVSSSEALRDASYRSPDAPSAVEGGAS